MNKKSLILNHQDILQKTKRIAYQIIEENFDIDQIILIGIKQQGYDFAQKLKEQIILISNKKITLHSITVDKKDPVNGLQRCSFNTIELEQQVIILIDDVANSGKTLFYALKEIFKNNA